MRITPGENLRVAFNAVWTHRFRAALTILGVVIGITTVVTVSSLLTGVRKGIVVFFEEFGPDNMFLNRFQGDPANQNVPPKQLKRRPILPEYADVILRVAPSVQAVGVSLYIVPNSRNPVIARVGVQENDNVFLVGVSSSQLEIQPRELKSGRTFTNEEAARGARVAIIGALLAEALFPDGRAVGSTFFVGGAEFTITGVYAQAKGGFFGENGLDRQIAIPLKTAELRYPLADRYMITAKARPGLRDQALEEVRSIVRRIRRTPPGAEDDFALTTPDQIIQQFDRLTGMVLAVSIALSGLGLLVGGIGVMNIMLVSVTERTREIGVRKAVGARRGDIVFQFLMEAVALTGSGGIIGIVFAILITMLIGALIPSLPSEVPSWAVLTGFFVSVGTGVFFGVWPAFKASRLDPVDALRYE